MSITKTSRPAHHWISRDFSRATIRALSKAGITILGAVALPGEGDLPFASGQRGYCLDNNGEHQIRTYLEVERMAAK